MSVFALADLHLSFGVKGKEMDVFGENWENHAERIKEAWESSVQKDDLVLIPGDISWALHIEDAIADLEWIDKLPGTKVMIKGNHDLWWGSKSKVLKHLPPSIHIIYNDAFLWNDIAIGGTRLWEHPDCNFQKHIIFRETPGVNVHEKPETAKERSHDEKIFKTEIERLGMSLDAMDHQAKHRIVMLHYPPTNPEHDTNIITTMLHNAEIDICLFGHLHNLAPDAPVNFEVQGVQYFCTATDYLNHNPLKIKLPS